MHLDFKKKTGTITLDSGHSLILGHKPSIISMDQIAKKLSSEKQDTANLGLFDTAAPNYTTYYPDVTADDLKPKDGDFIYPVFRLLSETIVQKGFKPIDFSKKGVLKKSMNKLLGQTINIDHETALGNAIGSVKEVFWQNAYTTSSGQKIPAGINGMFAIDGKSNPRIARGIMMDPPSIHSNSVSVRFKWEQSHTYETENEFYQNLGTKHEDGSMVRVIVTDVVQFTETSLVAHGADPYAQIIGSDNKIVNPTFADNVYSFSADNQKTVMHLDYKEDQLMLTSDSTIPEQLYHNIQNEEEMTIKEFLESLKLGDSLGEDLNEENFGERLTTLIRDAQSSSDEVERLTTENETLTTDLQTEKDAALVLTNTIAENAAKVTLADETLTKNRAEAKKFYTLIKGEKADEVILQNIEGADNALALSLLKQYKEESETLFPDTCQDCNSTNISRASASAGTDEDTEDKGSKVKTTSQVLKELRAKHKKNSIALGK